MSQQQTSQSEQSATTETIIADTGVNEGAPIGFFAIGIVINLVLLIAFFIWALREWKKPGARDKS